MAFRLCYSPNFIPSSFINPNTKHLCSLHSFLPSSSIHYSSKKREFPVPSVASIPYQPLNLDYLKEEFSGHGVTFEGLGDLCIAKLALANGSTAKLMLPSGLITSYMPLMWHGGTLELLQTSVLEGKDGNAVIQGGVSPYFNFESDGEALWSPSNWRIDDIRGHSRDNIQVELRSTDPNDMVDVRYIVSLREDTLSSELVVSNVHTSPIRFTGSLISHLTVSTPEATFACGLERSNFFTSHMLMSNFSIVPPGLDEENGLGTGQTCGYTGLKGNSPGWGAKNQKNADEARAGQTVCIEESEGEEDDNYKNLTEQMSRIYTSAPRDFTVIDRGRRNSVVVGREGFNELYMFSPGSDYKSYGKYSFVCVGQAAILKPVILSPRDVWTGGQHLLNPNL